MEQEHLEQSLSTGNTYTMYAVIQNGIVIAMDWEKKDNSDCEYIAMTLSNSPAFIGGKYQDGKFYKN